MSCKCKDRSRWNPEMGRCGRCGSLIDAAGDVNDEWIDGYTYTRVLDPPLPAAPEKKVDPRWALINGHIVRVTCKDGFVDVHVLNAERLLAKMTREVGSPILDDHRHLTWWWGGTIEQLYRCVEGFRGTIA